MRVGPLLTACDRATWTGRPDHALLLTAQTGLRISELTGLTRADVHLGAGAHVGCHSKGRKDRITPLTSDTITALRDWLSEHDGGQDTPLFPTRHGAKLSRDAVEHRLAYYTQRATAGCPSLRGKTVTRARPAAHLTRG